MAITSPKMGLRIWDQLTDPYDHAQLADNWSKVDFHDHTPGRGIPIPTEGIADGAITSPKLATPLDPSPAYTQYRLHSSYAGNLSGAAAAGTYILPVKGGGLVTPSVAPSVFIAALYLDPADFAVSSRALKLRVRGAVITNAVAPATTFTFGLYPVATWGGASGANPSIATLSAVTGGSTAAVTTPALGGPTLTTGADFDAPLVGWYVLGVVLAGATAASANVDLVADLQYRQV